MERGQTSERASSLLRDLRFSLQNVDANPGTGEVLYDQGLTRVHEVSDARRLRLLEVNQGLPVVLWVVLIGGGVVTVCFTYLFGLKNNWAHVLMVAALTLVICGILFTITTLEYPFAGRDQSLRLRRGAAQLPRVQALGRGLMYQGEPLTVYERAATPQEGATPR
jgi:hypothetical protein